VEVVLDQTPFYGESGGQVGDTGTLRGPGLEVAVTDTRKPVAPLVVHHGRVAAGTLRVGDRVELEVDGPRRDRIRANHSATHLLHRALKQVLGETVNQKGSVVSPENLRFDFSHFSPLTEAEIEQVEDLVNGWIRDNEAAVTREMKLDEARAEGAVALFGEKYGERVRVVTVHPRSTELCGGTHVRRSGDLGLFTLVQESSVAAGVRRVVGLTGAAAFAHLRSQERQLRQAADLFKATPAELGKRIEAAQRRVKELERKLEEAQLKASTGAARDGERVQEVNGIKVLTQRVDPAEPGVLRQLADRYRDQLRSVVVGLGGQTADGKALILVAATGDLVARGFKAGDAVRAMAVEVGGKGGGKPELAQAGGTDASKLDQAFARLLEVVKAV
jgi:alanyl-tRNA synthetase